MSIEVKNNPPESRYEAYADGTLAGFADYDLAPGTITFTHTEVLPEFEGQGVGGALAGGALDDVRASGERDVVPLCPFIKAYIDKHPEFQPLLHQGR